MFGQDDGLPAAGIKRVVSPVQVHGHWRKLEHIASAGTADRGVARAENK